MRKTKIATIVILVLASQVFGQEAEHKAAAVASAAFKTAKSEVQGSFYRGLVEARARV